MKIGGREEIPSVFCRNTGRGFHLEREDIWKRGCRIPDGLFRLSLDFL